MDKTLGQIQDEIYQAVSAYHTATMGDDRQEIDEAEALYRGMISIYGKETVQLVVDYYNENVIGKAR